MKISLFFQEITLITELPGSNFLLPTFLTGGKQDFQVANLLLVTVNFEPWSRLNAWIVSLGNFTIIYLLINLINYLLINLITYLLIYLLIFID